MSPCAAIGFLSTFPKATRFDEIPCLGLRRLFPAGYYNLLIELQWRTA